MLRIWRSISVVVCFFHIWTHCIRWINEIRHIKSLEHNRYSVYFSCLLRCYICFSFCFESLTSQFYFSQWFQNHCLKPWTWYYWIIFSLWAVIGKNVRTMLKYLNLLEKNKKNPWYLLLFFFNTWTFKKYSLTSSDHPARTNVIFISDPKENGLDKVFLIISQCLKLYTYIVHLFIAQHVRFRYSF